MKRCAAPGRTVHCVTAVAYRRQPSAVNHQPVPGRSLSTPLLLGHRSAVATLVLRETGTSDRGVVGDRCFTTNCTEGRRGHAGLDSSGNSHIPAGPKPRRSEDALADGGPVSRLHVKPECLRPGRIVWWSMN